VHAGGIQANRSDVAQNRLLASGGADVRNVVVAGIVAIEEIEKIQQNGETVTRSLILNGRVTRISICT